MLFFYTVLEFRWTIVINGCCDNLLLIAMYCVQPFSVSRWLTVSPCQRMLSSRSQEQGRPRPRSSVIGKTATSLINWLLGRWSCRREVQRNKVSRCISVLYRSARDTPTGVCTPNWILLIHELQYKLHSSAHNRIGCDCTMNCTLTTGLGVTAR